MSKSKEESLAIFQNRRKALFYKMPLNSMALLPGARMKYKNHDTEYPFRQESHFYYLVGFNEPNAVLVLRKTTEGEEKACLFSEKRDPDQERWRGKRAGVEGALQIGVEEAYPLESLGQKLREWLAETSELYYSWGHDRLWDTQLLEEIEALKTLSKKHLNTPLCYRELLPLIQDARLIKSEVEIACLQKAASVSAEAHLELMKHCRPGIREYELEGLFLAHCYQKGCRSMAYSPIVASGANACILHYNDNDALLREGDLILVDAGAECQYYAADITRTYPINGQFTRHQKALYEWVLKAQVDAIEAVQPGVEWATLQSIIVEVLVTGLLELGILTGDKEHLIHSKAYLPFYMHGSGHWLGLDVHDVGRYQIEGRSRRLEAGMVLTVEPGLYIDEHSNVAECWRGIGVRIEDDVLVTKEGHRVLTEAVPKTVEDIERLMKGKKKNGF